jgi:hypothetical protein
MSRISWQGQRQYLWRAVDQDGDVIDILLQPWRDRRAAAHRTIMPFPRANPAAGTRHAKVQIHGSSATVLVGAWDHSESVPCRMPPAAGSQRPNAAARAFVVWNAVTCA